MAVVITYKSESIPQDILIDIGHRFLIIHEENNMLILDGDDVENVRQFVGEDWKTELDLCI